MAESITEGTLAHFHKQIGDRVEVDEELASIETDKVDVSVSAPVAGVLAELLVALGDTVTTGQDVARIDTTAEPVATASQSSRVAAAKSSPAHSDSTADTEKMQSSTEQSSSERDANLVSQEQWRNKPLSDVIVPFPASNASTPASRVLEQPRPIESPNPQPRDSQAAMEIFPFRDERVVPLPRMRKTIAQRLKSSQLTNATLTTMQEVDMSALMLWRKHNQPRILDEHGVRLGYMGAFVKAATLAAQRVPVVNAALDIDKEEIIYRDYVDISVAVSTPKGLVTPVLKDCERLDIVQIEKRVRQLAEKARDGKLSMADLQGGNFSISNPGIFGSMFGTPVINYQQSAVFNMNTIYDRVVAIGGKPEIRPIMYTTLSYDYRLIEDREAVMFLTTIKDYIEAPSRMLLA